MHRDVHDGVPDNYIVVLKKGIASEQLEEHYRSVVETAKSADGGRGVVRTYAVDGFNGYHVECDELMLEVIRNSPVV
jgi:hypothetical protein